MEGRALPLYEEVYALQHYSKPRTHRAFLKTLKWLLPAHCVAIIVTDAGFRGPWFKAVEAQGWYWVGRVRNCINYRTVSRQRWRQTRTLYPRATAKPQYLGECELSSRRPYRCHLYLYKKTEQYRRVKRSSYHQAKHADNEVFARQQREPWLLATNLDPVHFKALRIVRLYGKRMGIEAGFRDLKSDEFGFGLSLSRSRRLDRLNMLLLIAALATVCLWWVGLIAEQSNWHRQFQANTVRDRRVLSVPYLGREVVRRGDYLITLGDLILAPQLLLQHISTAHEL